MQDEDQTIWRVINKETLLIPNAHSFPAADSASFHKPDFDLKQSF